MPFSQSSIVEVRRPAWDGSALHLEWTSTAPGGTLFQVYVDGALAWQGTARWVALPMPTSRVRVDVGSIGPGDDGVDFSAELPPAPGGRAELSWLGGTYLDPTGRDDVASFRIYGEPHPAQGVDMSRPLAEVPAYPAGIPTDGFGLGGFGLGGFGRAASAYRWASRPLADGTWTFALVPVDAAGNPGPPSHATVAISAPPRPPAAFEDGRRLRSRFDPADRRVTLSWNPSPSA